MNAAPPAVGNQGARLSAASVPVALCAGPGLVLSGLSIYSDVFKVFTPNGVPWQQFFGGLALGLACLATLICAPIGLAMLMRRVVRRRIAPWPAVGLMLLLVAPAAWAFWDMSQ